VSRVVADFTVGDGGTERVEVRASCADDELADAARRVEDAGGGLRGEALVLMLVPGDDHLGAGMVERLPQRLRCRPAAVCGARAEARVVPVGEGAARLVQGEIVPQPAVLR